MKRLLVGLVSLAALAQPAWANKLEVSDVRIDMTRPDSRDQALRNQVFVTVDGLARPTAENLVLYPAGQRGNAVHPTLLRGDTWKDGPVALAIVYQGTSPEMVRVISAGLTAFKHGGAYPDGMRVTVVEYTDRVDVRLPWSHISSLGPDVFEAARAAKPTARAAAISYAASELERSGRPRKVLVIVGDACDLTGYVTPFDEGPEIMNLVFGSLETCEHVHDQIPYARVVRKPEHIRFALADAIGPSWYARFDVRSLGVLETGDRELVLDVAGYVSDPIRVSFPGPEPSWFSSRLRQLGLGALLVGLIALAIRSRFRARAR